MGRRERRKQERRGYEPVRRDTGMTAREVAMERHRLFVEVTTETFGELHVRALWREAERRLTFAARLDRATGA